MRIVNDHILGRHIFFHDFDQKQWFITELRVYSEIIIFEKTFFLSLFLMIMKSPEIIWFESTEVIFSIGSSWVFCSLFFSIILHKSRRELFERNFPQTRFIKESLRIETTQIIMPNLLQKRISDWETPYFFQEISAETRNRPCHENNRSETLTWYTS